MYWDRTNVRANVGTISLPLRTAKTDPNDGRSLQTPRMDSNGRKTLRPIVTHCNQFQPMELLAIVTLRNGRGLGQIKFTRIGLVKQIYCILCLHM